jgi:PAS domain S-box-containing protein
MAARSSRTSPRQKAQTSKGVPAASKRQNGSKNKAHTRSTAAAPPRKSARKKSTTDQLVTALSTYHEEVLAQDEQLRETQADLMKSHERYARLYDDAPVGYVTLDQNGVIEQANLTAVALLGCLREMVIGRPMMVFIHKQDRPAFLNFMLVCRSRGVRQRHWAELRLDGRRRGTVHVQFSTVGVTRDSGKGIVYLTTLTDVTGRIRLEEERRIAEQRIAKAEHDRAAAQSANEAKDRFLAMLSHELRTPLSAILLWSKLLQDNQTSNPEQLCEGLHAIATSAESQRQLIEDLLDMSRIAAGKVRLEMQKIELALVVGDALNAIQPSAAAKNITVSAELDPAVGAVRADPDRLRQVVWNLLTNAVKFTPVGGQARLELWRRRSSVEIMVRDNGCGISPAFLPHVFETFRQADSSNTRQHAGLGLGLAIVKQLVEMHGGTVSAHSAGVGRGARFSVRLPLPELSHRSAEQTARPHDAPATAAEQFRRGSVLVVEDDPQTRSAVAALLRQTGLQVTEVESAASAIISFEQSHPDLLISDIGLPEMDGYELIDRIRMQELEGNQPPVPAIALTAFARDADRRMAIEAGYQKHVGKPVQPEQLLSAVRVLMPAR